MIARRARPAGGARAAVLVGLVASFVASVDLVRAARPRLFFDPEPGWAMPRLLLGLALAAAAAGAGLLAAAAFRWIAGKPILSAPLDPLALPPGPVVLVAALALAGGVALRVGAARTLDLPFLEDEVNLVGPALGLTGTARDFSDAIRPIPYGRPDPHEMIGVAYLRLLRRSLDAFGATAWAIRLPSLAGGVLSLFTAALLGRRLLPRGGGALTALVLAGLRWHVILSVSGWHSILLAPLSDAAALLLLRARRSGMGWTAAAAGAVAGLGAHFYLAAWVGGSGLLLFSLWPDGAAGALRRRMARALLFAVGFALAAAPLFLFAEGRRIPYFGRAGRHSVAREMRFASSPMPLLAAAADSFPAPWFLPDPEGRHDLAGASRLGWIVGVPFAVAMARALAAPREPLSALLLSHAAAALAGAVAAGQAGHPNGFRFGYLTTLTAVAAAAGTLALAGLAARRLRRAAALAAIGALLVASLRGALQATVLWPANRATFDSFHGEDTLLGQTAARWESRGAVRVAGGLGRSDLTIDTVRRHRLELPAAPAAADRSRIFRVVAPGSRADPDERLVETVRDAWGRQWAVVFGRRSGAS